MRFVFPEINRVFDTQMDKVNTIVIENQTVFRSLVEDIQRQMQGFDGKSVLSDSGKTLPMDKNLELLSQFVPFDGNRKSLLHKISAAIEKLAVSEEWYQETAKQMGKLEQYLFALSFSLPCALDFGGIHIGSLLKASGMQIQDTGGSLGEKIVDLMELITEFDKVKLYVIINLRSYITDEEAAAFMDTVLRRRYHVLMVDNTEYRRLPCEERYIVDRYLCEIG